uniref:MARVEL domain-containing protein n=1 Tax=Ciona savignyi TaxID=51511 RepID=H2Z825_CIOSA
MSESKVENVDLENTAGINAKDKHQETSNEVIESPAVANGEPTVLETQSEVEIKTMDPQPASERKYDDKTKSKPDLFHPIAIVKTTGPESTLPRTKAGGTMTSPPNYVSNEPSFSYKRRTFLNFLKSFEGILFLFEIISSFLCWVLLVVWTYAEPSYRFPCPLGFPMFAFVTSWVLTTLLFIILLCGLDDKAKWMSFFRNPIFGIGYNIVILLFSLVAGSITASFAVKDLTQVLGACTAFSFILFLMHTSHSLVYFRRKFGKCPWSYLTGCNTECTHA